MVVHIKTGLGVGFKDKQKQAKSFAEKLFPITDWSKINGPEDIPYKLHEKAMAIKREIA